LASWKAVSLGIGSELILPSPERVFSRLWELLPSPVFLTATMATATRVFEAFALSMALGAAVGILSGLSSTWKALLAPPLIAIRATPVLALVLVALFWIGPEKVPGFAAILMALPVVAASVEEGARSMDRKLLEMGKAYGLGGRRIMLDIRLPSMAPFFVSGAAGAMGLCWKVVIAGEVLTQPGFAIGKELQDARVILETVDVFCWAIASVLLCALAEALFAAVRSLMRRHGYVG
jgi:NitT/TauT family transport system permease protein